ncbi:hypothetical protein QTP88_006790 [Uroleucon formosanum]
MSYTQHSRVYAPHYAIRGHQLERKTDRTLLSLLLYTFIRPWELSSSSSSSGVDYRYEQTRVVAQASKPVIPPLKLRQTIIQYGQGFYRTPGKREGVYIKIGKL